MSPPLRTRESNFALWEGLRGGDLQVVATDHCPFDFKHKKDMFGRDDYKKIPRKGTCLRQKIYELEFTADHTSRETLVQANP